MSPQQLHSPMDWTREMTGCEFGLMPKSSFKIHAVICSIALLCMILEEERSTYPFWRYKKEYLR